MPTLTITAKGQVTFRKDLLRHLGAQPGEQLTVNTLPGGRIEVSAAQPSGRIADVFGILAGKINRSLSIEEMNDIAADGWAGKA